MRLGKGIIVVVVALVAVVAAPSASFAGKKNRQDLQKNFAAMYGDIQDISSRFSTRVPSGLAKRAQQARRMVKTLSKDDLAQLRSLLRMAPNWQEIPALMESAMQAEKAQRLVAQASPPNCPAGLSGGIMDWFIARGAAQGLNFATIFAPSDLVTVAAGAGGTVSAHPIKLALQTAFEAANSTALALEATYFIADECEEDAHRELLRQVDDKIDEVGQQIKTMKAAQRQIMRLLLTPQGRREIDPDVLTCTGDDCPQVIACPGDECSFPIEPGP